MELTPAGQVLLERCEKIFQELEDAQNEVKRYGAGEKGSLRIGCEDGTTFSVLPPLLENFQKRYPAISCSVVTQPVAQQIAGLQSGDLDVGIIPLPIHHPGLELIKLHSCSLMAAFAERFGFEFVAHERGDANRSARVERGFWFIERNFLAGRTFASWEDLNQQARQWCDKVNSTYKKHLRAVPRELFAVERLHLKPLPAWIPEVYRLHQRLVDVEGYMALHSNRYSVPVDWIGRRVEVRETKDKIEIQLDARHLITHRRLAEAENQRITLAEHRPPRGQRVPRPDPHPEEKAIITALPELADYVAGLKQHSRKIVTLALRQLWRFVREYPREPLLGAVREAARYGLYDLDRLERMILRRVTREYFLLDPGREDDD